MSDIPAYKNLIVTEIENPKGLKVGQIMLNRPEVLNALNIETMSEVLDALRLFDKNKEIGCIIITGSSKAIPPANTTEASVLI